MEHETKKDIYQDMLAKSTIYVLSDYDEVERIFKQINDTYITGTSTCGFDAEWNSFKVKNRPIALIQISIGSKDKEHHTDTYLIKMIDVFGTRAHSEYSTCNLVKFLENPDIYKVGVNITSDRVKLMKDYQIQLTGFIELGNMYSQFKNLSTVSDPISSSDVRCTVLDDTSSNTAVSADTSEEKLIYEHEYASSHLSLAALTNNVCGYVMPKHSKIRCSDWEGVLTESQTHYAAADSYYGLMIFRNLTKNQHVDPLSLVGLNVPKKRKRVVDTFPTIDSDASCTTSETKLETKLESKKVDRKLKGYDISVRPIYENYTVNNKHGDFMFHCNKRKADWYVKKCLGKYVDEKVVQLSFHTKGDGFKFDEYWNQEMICRCVICGTEDRLVHHQIVPKVFRTYFPLIFKTKNGYDRVAMCIKCKVHVSDKYSKKMSMMLTQYSINLSETNRISPTVMALKKVRQRCELLKYCIKKSDSSNKKQIPDNVIREIESEIRDYCKRQYPEYADVENDKLILSVDLLDRLCSDTDKMIEIERESYRSTTENEYKLLLEKIIGVSVSEDMCKDVDGIKSIFTKIFKFETMWRNFFLSTCKPKFLPKGWKAEYVTPSIGEALGIRKEKVSSDTLVSNTLVSPLKLLDIDCSKISEFYSDGC